MVSRTYFLELQNVINQVTRLQMKLVSGSGMIHFPNIWVNFPE